MGLILKKFSNVKGLPPPTQSLVRTLVNLNVTYTGAEESATVTVQDYSPAEKEPIQTPDTPAQDAVDELEAVSRASDEEEHDEEESEDVPAEDTEDENKVADTKDEEQVQDTQENEGTYLV